MTGRSFVVVFRLQTTGRLLWRNFMTDYLCVTVLILTVGVLATTYPQHAFAFLGGSFHNNFNNNNAQACEGAYAGNPGGSVDGSTSGSTQDSQGNDNSQDNTAGSTPTGVQTSNNNGEATNSFNNNH